jgi:hypothetical protein
VLFGTDAGDASGHHHGGWVGAAMPDRKLFDGLSFDPETIACMSEALAGAFAALGIADALDDRKVLLAKKIIELARTGERDPGRLKTIALKAFRQ